MSMITTALAYKQLREILRDYNDWGRSESDAPLTIKRTKRPLSAIDDERLLSWCRSWRRKEGLETPAQFRVVNLEVAAVFSAHLKQLQERITQEMRSVLERLSQPVEPDLSLGDYANWVDLNPLSPDEMNQVSEWAEQLEFLSQLFGCFHQLETPRVALVSFLEENGNPHPNSHLYLMGGCVNGTVYANTLLTQT